MLFTIQTVVALLLPVLAASALPAPLNPREDPQPLSFASTSQSVSASASTIATLNSTSTSLSATLNGTATSTSTGTADAAKHSASLLAAQASSILKNLQSELSAVDPSGTAYTAYITTISSRLAVEMSSIGGPPGQPIFVAVPTSTSVSSRSTTVTVARPTATSTNRADDAASSPTSLPVIPTSLPSGGPELSSVLSEIASAELHDMTNLISFASKTAELTAYITEVAGTPYVALSSISGPAITLAATSGAPGAFQTSFDDLEVTAVPSRNAAQGLSVQRPLLTGVVGALGAVGVGAMMLL